MEIQKLYQYYSKSFQVETDTRKDLNGCMFFALKGENFNGNTFATKALEKGANYAVVDEKEYATDKRIFLVENVLRTLQELASYHRDQLKTPLVALTGSNGKTTTKELIAAVLSTKFNCVATRGNLNNHIGVPLTLLSMKPETEIAVIEMGANHPGEISLLCNIAHPDYGYITNFGKVHLEGFGSLQGVIEAKTEMYRYLQDLQKKVFVNAGDAVQMERSADMARLTFGDDHSDYPVKFIKADPFVSLHFWDVEINSRLIGKYNYLNIAAACAIGSCFGVSVNEIKQAVEAYTPSNNRSQIIQKGSNKIILDAYNANPNSMQVALENLFQLTDKKKVAILGDMFEIGKDSLKEHQTIAELILNSDIQKIFLIGKEFSKVSVSDNRVALFDSFNSFKENFDKRDIENSTVLIKASRGMALERVLDLL